MRRAKNSSPTYNEGPKDESSPNKDGNNTPRSILMQKSDPSLAKDIRKRGTRVSFAGRNMSLMSLDDRSFSNLIDSISDPEGSERNMSENSNDSRKSISRKMGFPMRLTVAQRLAAGTHSPPIEVSQMDDGPQEKVSSLTISEHTPVKSEGDFSKLAGQVENPGGVSNSLKLDLSLSNVMNMSNLSAMNMSNMSLSSDIDGELLK